VAVSPLGPTQNSRFWGIGNQLETLLLAPILAGAAIAGRRLGVLGFATFGALGLVLMTDNRFGADGGGAIVLGVALAFLGARTFRLGWRGFGVFLAAAAVIVAKIVSSNLNSSGPYHLRSAFGHGLGGIWAVARDRVPLSYMPAIHNWPVVMPLAVWCAVSFAAAVFIAHRRPTRDFVLTLGVATVTSLLVNDSAMYVVTGAVAVLGAIVRFVPAPAVPFRLRSLVRLRAPVPVRSEVE
jgi:hypothetical protein